MRLYHVRNPHKRKDDCVAGMVTGMARSNKRVNVYLEIGKTKTIAAAIDWPGWCRIARNEADALQALCDHGPRYAKVLKKAKLPFALPADADAFHVVERLKGTSTTDFGAPDCILEGDSKKLAPHDLKRYEAILRAHWQAFDQAVKKATGATLRKGPRGGGRDLNKIVQHVLEVDAAYLRNFAGMAVESKLSDVKAFTKEMRAAILAALKQSSEGKLPTHGPRGGQRWPAHYFVRRLLWHELDHVWEMEDRAE